MFKKIQNVLRKTKKETKKYLLRAFRKRKIIQQSILFEPNAPEQNSVEDIWLKEKIGYGKNFCKNKTFSQVKQSFFEFFENCIFNFNKFSC